VAKGKPQKALALAPETDRVPDEGWRLRKNGSRFWSNVVMTAVRDESGKLLGFSKVTRDITALKNAEETILRANAELETRVAERSAELAQANRSLESELAQRQRAQEEIRQLNGNLERRVAERTTELERPPIANWKHSPTRWPMTCGLLCGTSVDFLRFLARSLPRN
jgi:hypothetical protein